MALLTRLTAPGSPKALQRFQNCIGYLWPPLHSNKSTHIDAIECFTNELISRKARKWETLRDNLISKTEKIANAREQNDTASNNVSLLKQSQNVLNNLKAIRSPELGLDIRTLSQAQVDNLLLSTLEIKNKIDFLYLIKQCITWQQLPSKDVLIECLKYLSSLSKTQQIDQFIEICHIQKNPLLKIYANLAPFKAMAMWRNGSSEGALEILHNGYSSCSDDQGRRMIRIAFKTMAEETLAQKSEAVLVGLTQIATQIYKEHQDIFILACVWKNSFVSDWFSDQKFAEKLFEEYSALRTLVGKKSQSLCISFLRINNIDAVHRLVEAFLHYNDRDSCSTCLTLLFNYQYRRKDLRACAEIIKSCNELEMPLSEIQNSQFLNMFLNQSEPPVTYKSSKRVQKPFEYKF